MMALLGGSKEHGTTQVNVQPPPTRSYNESYTINQPQSQNANVLEHLTVRDLSDMELKLVEKLSGYTKGKRSTTDATLKKLALSRDDWIPLVPMTEDQKVFYEGGEYPLLSTMPLGKAIIYARQITDMLDPSAGTTFFNPLTTNTVEIARQIGILSIFLLDDPWYEYDGSGADLAMIGVGITKKIHELLNRSLGGFFTNKLTESTTNIYKNEGTPMVAPPRNKMQTWYKTVSGLRW